jgi:hypothetical protein
VSRSATATAIFSPSLAPIVPAPSAPNAPYMLFNAAGELATARNIFGAVPKAPLISSSSGFAAPVAVAGSTRFTLVSFACKRAAGSNQPAGLEPAFGVFLPSSGPRTGSARSEEKAFAQMIRPPPGPAEKMSWLDLLARAGARESVPVACHFEDSRLLMFGAIEAQGAVAEGRIDECAVMRFRRLRMHIRPEIFAGNAHALPRNCLA